MTMLALFKCFNSVMAMKIKLIVVVVVVRCFCFNPNIVNKAEWLGSPANIKGANKDAKI